MPRFSWRLTPANASTGQAAFQLQVLTAQRDALRAQLHAVRAAVSAEAKVAVVSEASAEAEAAAVVGEPTVFTFDLEYDPLDYYETELELH